MASKGPKGYVFWHEKGVLLVKTMGKIKLASGKTCQLTPIRNDLIRNYYLLAFPKDQGEPSSAEVTEMLNMGIDHAQSLAVEKLGDPEAFSILYSGYSARREKGWHVHIVLLGSRWRKAWLYAVLAGKNGGRQERCHLNRY